MIRVAVTGACGQIGYSLLFRIASGEVFGKKTPIALHLLDLPESMECLKGVVMELRDSAYPLLQDIVIGSDPYEVFADINYAILVGAKPRGPGMERSDLLHENGKIFAPQGKALNSVAVKDIKVLVVGNPCNTNCLIAMHNAPDIPKNRFHAMTRLDQNRAQFQLSDRAGVPLEAVTRVAIWGNHSATQVPDFYNARINGKPALDVINDLEWLQNGFMQTVQKRGAAVIAARGKSSAASAANAILDELRSVHEGGEIFSSAVISDGNPYGVQDGLIFSFPLKSSTEIAKDFELNDFLREKIALTEKELVSERDLVRGLLA